jgi:hypothetical protein
MRNRQSHNLCRNTSPCYRKYQISHRCNTDTVTPYNIASRRHSLEPGLCFNGTNTPSRQFLAREAGFLSMAEQTGIEMSAIELRAYMHRLLSLASMVEEYHAFLPVRSHCSSSMFHEWLVPTDDVQGTSSISSKPVECQPSFVSIKRRMLPVPSRAPSFGSICQVSRACVALRALSLDVPKPRSNIGTRKLLHSKRRLSSRQRCCSPVTPRVDTDRMLVREGGCKRISTQHHIEQRKPPRKRVGDSGCSVSLTQLYRRMTTRLHQHTQHSSNKTFRFQICPVSTAVHSI